MGSVLRMCFQCSAGKPSLWVIINAPCYQPGPEVSDAAAGVGTTTLGPGSVMAALGAQATETA